MIRFKHVCTFAIAGLLMLSCDNDDTEECTGDNSINQVNTGCSNIPSATSVYLEVVNGDLRSITCNTYPNHDFGTFPNGQVTPNDRSYEVDLTPVKASSPTSILNNQNVPRYYFGVGLNGIPFDPAPAEPFIFTNTTTGDYNWDWVFEPNNNQTEVGLDCAVAHVGPWGYHYHGDMMEYADVLYPGVVTLSSAPDSAVHIGWASDGFPVLYKWGPDENGNLKLLQPSYQLKSGEREGDGISAPCGTYTGKYTNDYEFVNGLGDLDASNGVERSVTLNTAQGIETFSYFYVITDGFPVMSRSVVGAPDPSFEK